MTDNKPWWQLKEEDLLNKKISDLGLHINGTWVAPLIQRLYQELDQKGLKFRPPCFFADEWFVPVGIPAIGIPFYLAHPRLMRLEQKIILEVEGGSKREFMKLIRHEAGHAYSYAYHLQRKRKWRELFGPASREYPDTYRPKPYSRSYVIHLDSWYAQSHPDEDFAETFAVWLTPGMPWKKRYKNWKAMNKLQYVDQLMTELKGKKALHQPHFDPAEYAGLNQKLKTFYREKKKLYEEDFPDFYDRDLRLLFTDDPDEKGDKRASRYLREHNERIVKAVSQWTKERKYTITQLVKDLMYRCDELNLYVRKRDPYIDYQIAAFFTALISNHLFTGKFKVAR